MFNFLKWLAFKAHKSTLNKQILYSHFSNVVYYMIYLEYLNPQYLYEIVFWIVTFLLLRKFWSKEKVRLAYGYIVAGLNLVAVGLFAFISIGRIQPGNNK